MKLIYPIRFASCIQIIKIKDDKADNVRSLTKDYFLRKTSSRIDNVMINIIEVITEKRYEGMMFR